MKKKTKLGKKRVPAPQSGKKKTMMVEAFEDYLHLKTFVQISLKGREVGAALLQKNNTFQFVFGFSCQGIHDTLRPEQVLSALNGIESGLKELPNTGWMTLHLSSFANDTDRQAELQRIIQDAPSAELKLLLMSERARSQELAVSGARKRKELNIYVTYQMDAGQVTTAESDWIEKALAKSLQYWDAFKGKGEEQLVRRYEDMIASAFTEGYMRWEQLINIKMGLEIKPLTVDKLWRNLWRRFNQGDAPEVPQYLTFNGSALGETINNPAAPATVLVQGENGRSSIPKADRRWIRIQNRYVGALTFNAKPAGFVNMRSQLRYLWDVLCRPHIRDTEVFCQISAANPNLVKTNMQRLLKQSNVAAEMAAQSSSVDVAATIKTKRSIEAQEKLYEGAIPVKVATVFLVHRETPAKLAEACRGVSECFQLPAKVIEETELTWMYWLQTLPVAWDRLLGYPFQRQLTYLSNEAPGLMPLTMTRKISSSGFELIADEGGSPVKIDFTKEHRNIAIFGTTRSGKSVTISGMLTQFLAEGYPIVCLDYPKPDGTSTFTDYAHFLEPRAAYFDIGRESNNLLEMPDLRHLSEEEQDERFQDYKSFLESALVTMVLPNAQDQPLLEQTVRSLIGRALTNFFMDEGIRARYVSAIAEGYGSNAWNFTPTLQDFKAFCSTEALALEESAGPQIMAAASQIRLQLDYWLNSRIGQAIGRPSSFPTNAQLLVFALRNLSNESEAAILSLSAYSAALRRALESPKSIFFIDESPILFEYTTISQLIGRLCANGAKAGIRVFLSAQDPDTIMKSASGAKVMQNMNTRLIGRIQALAVESFVKLLQYERFVIARNASESFFPKRSELYSNWLLDIDGNYIYCRYYPSAIQIAAVANNPDEQSARDRVLAQFDNKLKGMAHFAKLYVEAIRSGSSLDDIGQTTAAPPLLNSSADASGNGYQDGIGDPSHAQTKETYETTAA